MSRASALTLALVLGGTLGVASHSGAVPTVDLSWGNCSPIAPAVTDPLRGPHHLFASVTGQEEGHRAYQLYVHLRSAQSQVPDAWRFDAAGCQPNGLEIRHIPPGFAAKTCPAFHGTQEPLVLKDYSYDATIGQATLFLALYYSGGVAAPNPATRYFLLDAIFDHTNSVVGSGDTPGTCAGFEHDITLSLIRDLPCPFCSPRPPMWADLQGGEHDFAIGQGSVTFCGSCAPVPARGATWGQIKGQYRR